MFAFFCCVEVFLIISVCYFWVCLSFMIIMLKMDVKYSLQKLILLSICTILSRSMAWPFDDVNSAERCVDDFMSLPAVTVEEYSNFATMSSDAPFVISHFVEYEEVDELVDKITNPSNIDTGKLWRIMETDPAASSVFQYTSSGLALEHKANMKRIQGDWMHSQIWHNFADFSQCHGVRHYSILKPVTNLYSEIIRIAGLSSNLPEHARDINVFAGCNRTATALHFDLLPNYFLNLVGTKRFYLFPPETYDQLLFAPSSHPLYRQSLLVPNNLSFLSSASLPMQHKYMVELHPGDVLFLPSYWCHFVVATSDTIGVSMRGGWNLDDSEYRQLRLHPLPFESHWTVVTKFLAIRLYLQQFLNRTQRNIIKQTWSLGFPEQVAAFTLHTTQYLLVDATALSSIISDKIKLYASRLEFSGTLSRVEYAEDVVSSMLTDDESIQFIVFYL